jgi:hypothetical protein
MKYLPLNLFFYATFLILTSNLYYYYELDLKKFIRLYDLS